MDAKAVVKWGTALLIGLGIITVGFRFAGWLLTGFFILNCLVLIVVVLLQSGPLMTVTIPGISDPSGTNFGNLTSSLIGNGGRADTVKGVDPYQGQSLNQWINQNAFSVPADNIGRFGDSLAGAVQGPSTKALSLSLLKRIAFTESTRLEIGAQISNVFNHPNFASPNPVVFSGNNYNSSAGAITATANPSRQIQFALKLLF